MSLGKFSYCVIATFHTDIATHIKYIFIGFHHFHGDINDVVWTKKRCKNQITKTPLYHKRSLLNGEDGPRGAPSHEALSVSSQGALEISSVIGEPPSLVSDLFSSPRVVAKSCQRDKGRGPSPLDHNIRIFTDTSNEGWGLT